MPQLRREGERPLSVTIIASLLIAVGAVGFAYHAMELRGASGVEYDELLVLLVRLLAIVGGVYVLRGANWARWLVIAWMAYHVGLSALHSVSETAIHGVLLAVIAYVLLRPEASAYFRGASQRRELPHG
jgi:hypothetical protein